MHIQFLLTLSDQLSKLKRSSSFSLHLNTNATTVLYVRKCISKCFKSQEDSFANGLSPAVSPLEVYSSYRWEENRNLNRVIKEENKVSFQVTSRGKSKHYASLHGSNILTNPNKLRREIVNNLLYTKKPTNNLKALTQTSSHMLVPLYYRTSTCNH